MTDRNRDSAIRAPRWLAWLFVAVAAAGLSGIGWIEAIGCGPFIPFEKQAISDLGLLLNGIGFIILGPLLIFRRKNNPISWLSALIGTFVISILFVDLFIDCGMKDGITLPGLPYASWFDSIVTPYYFVLQFILLPMIFPTGRFISSNWRKTISIGLGILIVSTSLFSLLPWQKGVSYSGTVFSFDNPFGWTLLPAGLLLPIVRYVEITLVAVLTLAAIGSLILRWRSDRKTERQQLKWTAYYLTVIILPSIFLGILDNYFLPEAIDSIWYSLFSALSFAGFPLTIGIAIFKYRLYDIDLIIRRTVSYAAVTGVLALVFFGSVVALQTVFRAAAGNPESPLITVLSTLAIAALFNPLRTRVQDFIDRRFYRARYDAGQALERFAETARDEVDMDELEESLHDVVEQTVKPKRVSLWLTPIEEETG